MEQPLSFEAQRTNGEKLVYRLNKAFYGLRLVPRAWFHTLRRYLVDQLHFQPFNPDHSLFV